MNNPGGSTKRKFGDIWGQLAVSFCVLLVPPLLMAAAITYLDFPPAHGAAEGPLAVSVYTGSKPDALGQGDAGPGGSFVAASGQQRPITEPHPPVEELPDGPRAAAARSTETTDDIPAAFPDHPPGAAPKSARNDSRNGHRSKRQGALSDIFPFLRSSGR
jgi:hypothetical protein